MTTSRALWISIVWVTSALLSACGGGGGNPGTCQGSDLVCGRNLASTSRVVQTTAQPGAIPSSASLANSCAIPDQQKFTRAYLNEVYLWYNEVRDIVPGTIPSVEDHFYASLSPVRDSTGALQDRFSFIVPNTQADSIASGANIGYGAEWVRDSADRLRITRVAPGSPAAQAGLARGGELVRVISSTTGTAGNPLYPNAAASISFSYRATPSSAERIVSMNSVPQVDDPVPQYSVLSSPAGKRVGYVQFDAHTRGAQDKLIDTVLALQASSLETVVLDLRYNGGGFIYTALSLATMLSSSSNENKIFERLQFNDKRPEDTANGTFNFTGALLVGEQRYAKNYALPRLAMQRVYVLATGNTCSASEAVVNGLRGVDVEVVIVGGTTCGKPYGFSRQDNCGLSYYPIEFVGTNQKGFSDYSRGFEPTCAALDDLDNPLGNTRERLLSTALSHVDSGVCPATAAAKRPPLSAKTTSPSAWQLDLPGPKIPGRLYEPRR